MSNQSHIGDTSFESTTIQVEPVTVTRDPETREDGVVITYTIVSNAQAAIDIDLEDTLPTASYSEIGFHPDHAPISWDLNKAGVGEKPTLGIEHAIDAEDEGVLKLGIVIEESQPGTISFTGKPKVTGVRPRASADVPTPSNNDDSDETSGFFERAKETLFRREKELDSNEDAVASIQKDYTKSTNGNDQKPIADTKPDVQTESTSKHLESSSTIDNKEKITVEKSDDQEDPIADQTKQDKNTTDQTHKSTPNGYNPSDVDADPVTQEQELTDTAVPNVQSDQSGEDSLLQQLIAEIEQEPAQSQAVDQVREAFQTTGSRSETLRLQHVQSRMDDFSAYISSFEEFIDEFGTLSEFATDLHADIDELHYSITAIQEEIDSLETEVNDFKSDLTVVEGTIDRIESDVQETTTELDQMSEEFNAKFAEQVGRQDALKSELESLDTKIESEINNWETLASDFEQVRNTLLNAFGSPDSNP